MGPEESIVLNISLFSNVTTVMHMDFTLMEFKLNSNSKIFSVFPTVKVRHHCFALSKALICTYYKCIFYLHIVGIQSYIGYGILVSGVQYSYSTFLYLKM